jgi:YVTN family beta-propeller protein
MIDPLARRVVATIDTGRRATAAAFFEPGAGEPAAPVLYVARDGRDGGTLLALTGAAAPASLDEAARLAPSAALDAGDDPRHVALTPDGTEVWTVDARDGRVSVFDRLTSARRGAFDLPRDIVDRPSSLAFSDDGRFAYVVGSRSASLAILDRQRSETPSAAWIAGTVPLGERPAAIVSIVADTERARLYVGRDRDIVVLTVEDPRQPTIIGSVRLGSDVAGLAFLEGGTTLYATLPRQDRVEVLRVSAAGQGGVSLESLGPVVVGRHPTGLAVTRPDSTRQAPILVVANTRSSTVSLIDTATHAVVATLPVHGAPAAVVPAVVPIAVR